VLQNHFNDMLQFVDEKKHFVGRQHMADDEKSIGRLCRINKVQLIIAPHEVNASRINNLQPIIW